MKDPAEPLPVYGEPRHAWLDWLRGVSILLVLFTHFQVDWRDAGLFQPLAMANMRIGWSGVDFFFLISGFLIGNLLLGEIIRFGRLDVRRFCLRRILKIWPLYYLACLVYVLTAPWLAAESRPQAAALIAPALFHVQNYFPPAMGHLWSLAVEEHFYVLLPLLLWSCFTLASRERFAGALLKAILIGIVAVFGLRFAYVFVTHAGGQAVRPYTHLRMDSLFAGVLLAWLYRYRPDRWQWLATTPMVLGAMAFAGAIVFAFNPNSSLFVAAVGYTSVQLLFAAVLLFASRYERCQVPPRLRRPLAGLAWIGRRSYPIYLFHPFLWTAFGPGLVAMITGRPFAVRSALWLAGFVAFVTGAVALGAVIGDALEKPLLRLRNRIVPPRTLAFDGAPIAQPGRSIIADHASAA